jgi:hypothetical protein
MNEALKLLHDLNEICNLGDLIYHVRENEGLGWGGPNVVAWGNACKRMEELLENYGDGNQDESHQEA